MSKLICQLICITFLLFLFSRCEKEKTTVCDPIEIQSGINHVTDYNGNNGSIDLTVSGGCKPLTFLWSNSAVTEDLENLSAGIYIVTVSDSEYNLIRDTFVINQPQLTPLKLTFEVINPSSTGVADGAINTTIEGGLPPYSVRWSNGSETPNISGLSKGEYSIIVTDNASQTATDTVVLVDALTDIDGNKYATVKIGNQIWMKENLKVTQAHNGSQIVSYIYNNNTSNLVPYGRLYTWNVAMNGSTTEKAQGICPDGWHIPSDEEVKQMEMALGMTRTEADMANTWRGNTIGTKLKAGGSSGFDVMLSGRRSSAGSYSFLGQVEYFWTSTESGNLYAWRRCFDLYDDKVGRYDTFQKSYGFSVRCIKND
jgi:uncharacterized protein (TIGR02145 family)